MLKKQRYNFNSAEESRFREKSPKAGDSEQTLFLKTKLVETHNRLLEQLDLSKQQQTQIIELNRENQEQAKLLQELKLRLIQSEKGNVLKQDYDYTKSKLKSQALEKAKLKEEMSYLGEKYTELEEKYKNLAEHSKSLNQQNHQNLATIQSLKKKNGTLQTQNDKFLKQIEQLKAEQNKSKNKISQSQRFLKEERQINKSYLQQQKSLQGKLFNMHLKLEQLQQENVYLKTQHLKKQHSNSKTHSNTIEQLKYDIAMLQDKLKQKQETLIQAKKKKYSPIKTTKKNDYDQTYELIKRLEEAELMTRNRHSTSFTKFQRNTQNTKKKDFYGGQLTFDLKKNKRQKF